MAKDKQPSNLEYIEQAKTAILSVINRLSTTEVMKTPDAYLLGMLRAVDSSTDSIRTFLSDLEKQSKPVPKPKTVDPGLDPVK